MRTPQGRRPRTLAATPAFCYPLGMRITPILACAAATLLPTPARGAQVIQALALSEGSPVVPGPSDYDPAKLDKDRFAKGSELDTPQLTYFPAPPSATPVASVIIC